MEKLEPLYLPVQHKGPAHGKSEYLYFLAGRTRALAPKGTVGFFCNLLLNFSLCYTPENSVFLQIAPKRFFSFCYAQALN